MLNRRIGVFMKKKILVLVAIVMLVLTGCTSTLTDSKGNRVINKETGQNLTANILCQPEDKKLISEYKKNEKQMDFKIEELPKCTKMKVYEKKSYIRCNINCNMSNI